MSSVSHMMPDKGAGRRANDQRVIVDFRPGSVHLLIAEERYQSWIAWVEKERLLREAGLSTPGIGEHVAAIREAIGAALIRLGKRLRGEPAGSAAADATSPV